MSDFIMQLLALIQAHAYAGIGGLVMATFVTLLTDRAKFFPTWDNPLRPFLGTLAGAIGLVMNGVQDGGAVLALLLSVMATTGPTLLAEVVALLNSKSQAKKAAARGFAEIRVMLSILVAAALIGLSGMITSCSAAKGVVCPVIHAADVVCPYLVLDFPDGHQEKFLKEDVINGARKEAAARAARGADMVDSGAN